MKNYILLIACLLAWRTSFAQKTIKISGKIVDETGESAPYALVKLLSLPDSSLVKSVQTDLAGDFVLEQVTGGAYMLSIKMVGFKDHQTAKFGLTADVVIPTIKMQNLSKQLNAVTVVVKKQFVERRSDKTILNLENSIATIGNSALEVLEKAPGVTIDRQNDQIKLNNKGGITVMIDGKTNFLSGADITTLLSNMSSDQISTIELITNPSSKYDAAGASGIINIKLKRNKSFGTNGNIALNTGEGIMPNFPTDLYRVGLSVTLNHRINKWNVYGTAAFNRKVDYNTTNVLRSTATSSLASSFNQNFLRDRKGFAYMGKIGADYYASEKTVIGVMVDANSILSKLNNVSETNILEIQNNVQSINAVNQLAFSHSPVANLTANFNVKHDFNNEGTNLTFDADYSGFSNEKDDLFNAKYLDNASILTKTTDLRNFTNANINVFAAKADFTRAVDKTIKVETGLKASYVKTNNSLIAEQMALGIWQNDAGKSNNFIYKENINAAYANLAKDWKDWKVQVGLRAEYTHSNGNSVTSNNKVVRNYLSLFPTFFLNRTLNENNSISTSFSRRVDRPNYQQLNPFVFYMDPYALDEGNPYLKPQFTYNLELNYNYKEASISLTYADTRDMITQITQQNEISRIVSIVRQNLGRAQTYSGNLYYPIKVAKFWKIQNNLSVFLLKFDDGNIEGAKYKASKVAFNLNHNESFTLPKNFSLEVGIWLNSPKLQGVEETTINQYAINASIQKSVMNNRLKIRAGMDDIFLTNHWEGKLQYQNVNLNVVNHYLSRRAAFSINYSFGNQNVKSARNRNTATEDIKGRAN